MEQQTVTVNIFLRIIYPDIHLRRMTYPPERGCQYEHGCAGLQVQWKGTGPPARPRPL